MAESKYFKKNRFNKMDETNTYLSQYPKELKEELYHYVNNKNHLKYSFPNLHAYDKKKYLKITASKKQELVAVELKEHKIKRLTNNDIKHVFGFHNIREADGTISSSLTISLIKVDDAITNNKYIFIRSSKIQNRNQNILKGELITTYFCSDDLFNLLKYITKEEKDNMKLKTNHVLA